MEHFLVVNRRRTEETLDCCGTDCCFIFGNISVKPPLFFLLFPKEEEEQILKNNLRGFYEAGGRKKQAKHLKLQIGVTLSLSLLSRADLLYAGMYRIYVSVSSIQAQDAVFRHGVG